MPAAVNVTSVVAVGSPLSVYVCGMVPVGGLVSETFPLLPEADVVFATSSSVFARSAPAISSEEPASNAANFP